MKKIKLKQIIVALIGVLVLIGVLTHSQGDTITDQVETIIPDEAEVSINMNELLGNADDEVVPEVVSVERISGSLADVSGGTATGVASATYGDSYEMVATFEGLPDPQPEGYFYEGWVVRRGANQSVISSGVATKTATGYENVFVHPDNLLDHDFYVLTLEPDDGDPAPAEHILEGVMQ